MNEQRLEQAEKEFVQSVGIGQFSYYMFADWLVQNEPDLCCTLLEDILRKRNQEKIRTEAEFGN
jgi:hypothetical protein